MAVPSPSPLEARLFQLLDPAGIQGSTLLLGRWVLHPISLPSRVLGRDVAVAVLLRELYQLLPSALDTALPTGPTSLHRATETLPCPRSSSNSFGSWSRASHWSGLLSTFHEIPSSSSFWIRPALKRRSFRASRCAFAQCPRPPGCLEGDVAAAVAPPGTPSALGAAASPLPLVLVPLLVSRHGDTPAPPAARSGPCLGVDSPSFRGDVDSLPTVLGPPRVLLGATWQRWHAPPGTPAAPADEPLPPVHPRTCPWNAPLGPASGCGGPPRLDPSRGDVDGMPMSPVPPGASAGTSRWPCSRFLALVRLPDSCFPRVGPPRRSRGARPVGRHPLVFVKRRVFAPLPSRHILNMCEPRVYAFRARRRTSPRSVAATAYTFSLVSTLEKAFPISPYMTFLIC